MRFVPAFNETEMKDVVFPQTLEFLQGFGNDSGAEISP
jgi:hypothetical protein